MKYEIYCQCQHTQHVFIMGLTYNLISIKFGLYLDLLIDRVMVIYNYQVNYFILLLILYNWRYFNHYVKNAIIWLLQLYRRQNKTSTM